MTILHHYIVKLIRLLMGFALIAVGIAVAKQSYCLSPWHVFNDGLAHVFPITMGQANIIVGMLILLLDLLLHETFGIGMVLNIWMTGTLTDLYLSINSRIQILPKIETLPLQVFFCMVSLAFNTIGVYLYMSACMGAGPRDSLVVFLTKRLPFPVGICKLGLEAAVCMIGWLIGGEIGLGTLLYVIFGGPLLQKAFQFFHFDVKKKKDESVLDTWQIITGRMSTEEFASR